MHWAFRTRFLAISLLALSLSGCFVVTVRHSDVKDGQIIGGPIDSYGKSPDSNIIVRQDMDGVAPKVYLQLIADSDQDLAGIRYSVEKYNQQADRYQNAGAGYKFAASNVDGQLVWAKHVELPEPDGKPILLDLSDTSLLYPLKLTVVAIERNGYSRVIEANYFQWPRILPIGGH